MLFEELQELAFEYWKEARSQQRAPVTSLLVLGPPGIGKSSCARSIAGEIAGAEGRRLVDLKEEPAFDGDLSTVALYYAADLSSCLPEDIGGIPKIALESVCGSSLQVTTYAVQRWLAPFCVPGAVGVICLDDLPAAPPAVAVAVRQLVLDRRVGQQKLSPGVLLFVTGNRRSDKAGASALPSHFVNSCTSYEIEPEPPPADPAARWRWREWYQQQGAHDLVPAFLRWRRDHFSRLPKDADAGGRFPTPRSWAFLGLQLAVALRCGRLRETATGLVGEGVAGEFVAFAQVFADVGGPDQVLDDPARLAPTCHDTPDKVSTLLEALTDTFLARLASAADGDEAGARDVAAVKYLRALGRVTGGNKEQLALALARIPSADTVALLGRTAKGHPEDAAIQALQQAWLDAVRARRKAEK